jgi:SAM-dependent methyltransferase
MADELDEYGAASAAFYDDFATGVAGDVAFYVARAREAGSPVLELGCGTGRILFAVGEAGVEIVGLDRSPHMLAVARRKLATVPPDVRRRVHLFPGDMCDFTLGRRFTLVLIPYRAFLHNLEPADQLRTLACAREHLAIDGRLVFNVFDPDVSKLPSACRRTSGTTSSGSASTARSCSRSSTPPPARCGRRRARR